LELLQVALEHLVRLKVTQVEVASSVSLPQALEALVEDSVEQLKASEE